MTSRSDRYSDRVEPDLIVAAGQRHMQRVSGPESVPAGGGEVAPAPEAARRVSRKQLTRLAAVLSDRDREVLASLTKFGFLTTSQVELLHFHDHATKKAAARVCRRVMARLSRDRLAEPLGRRIGGLRAGSASYVWRLGPVGDRVLRESRPDAPRARRKEPSTRFLDHRLAVADTICGLTLASRVGAFELVATDTEPASWRRFRGDYGGDEILKPDLFIVTADSEFEDHWFIEVDRATESLPTVLDKCAQYERYRRSGTEQATVGLFPRVLWLVPDDQRADRLRLGIEHRTDLDEQLFRIARYDQLLDVINNQEPKGGDHA